MTINRTNILSLFGTGNDQVLNNRSRYHSCILTTFSFDFCFFEMKVMKWLRSCGVRNTNVLIDGSYYSELMHQTTGEEMKFSTGYSLYPMFGDGIFHPKITMLFGDKEGLLIVGSGNLTGSGNGNNDEIWGAYHFAVDQPQHAPLFSAAWKYLSKLTTNVKGFTKEKITHWIPEHSKWLLELPAVKDFELLRLPDNRSIAFLYNSAESTIWQQVKQHLRNEHVTEVIAVSPYYDVQGKALEIIRSEYPDARFSVIMDERGRIPSSLPNEQEYSFFDWTELNISREIGAKQRSRLHAKILYFKTRQGIEYCLLGSANITPAGLGISDRPNAEVCLLTRSADGTLWKGIGLALKINKEYSLSNFAAHNHVFIEDKIFWHKRLPVKLFAAEINFGVLIFYSNIQHSVTAIVVLFDCNNKPILSQHVNSLQEQHEIKLEVDENQLQYIQLQNLNGRGISNKLIITHQTAIIKTHPNPKNAEFEKLYDRLQYGELRNILDLISYAITDNIEKQNGNDILNNLRGGAADNENKKQVSDTQLYDLSGYKPLNSNSHLQESGLLTSLSLRVLDAINIYDKHITTPRTEMRVDEQEEKIDSSDGHEEEEVPFEKGVALKVLEADKRKLKSFLKNLYGYFHHDLLFKGVKVSDYELTFTDLVKYLVGLELLHRFGGRTEKVESEQQLFFTYLPFSGDYENDNVKGCCLNIIGDFLRLAKNGFKEYTFDYTKKKCEQLRTDALISTLVCILNVYWQEAEQPYFKTLLLNTLHYLGWSSTAEFENNLNTLIFEVNEKIKSLKQRSIGLESQLQYFIQHVCPAFKQSSNKRESRTFVRNAEKGQIIYSSIAGIGYCYVLAVHNHKEYRLVRPGFNWNPIEEEYLDYFAGTVYTPLPLQTMTIIDL